MSDEKKRPVSPINGVPTPHGNRFTKENAREAQQKSLEVRHAKKAEEKVRQSIAQSFLAEMKQEQVVKENGKEVRKTGAQIVAHSIISACHKGNAKAIEIALALMGEKPAEVISVNVPDVNVMNEVRAFLKDHDQ